MTILLLGDLTGRSRVALRMLTGELENRGHEVLALPTALISNTLNLGRAAMADTTEYLLEALETWEALGGAETSVLVTSAGDAVAGKDARTGRRFRVPFRRIPGEHWGTGDRFCALLLDALAGGLPLEQAARCASDGVYEALLKG